MRTTGILNNTFPLPLFILGLPREVTEDTIMGGQMIPKGTSKSFQSFFESHH
jgi:hypothetical protein